MPKVITKDRLCAVLHYLLQNPGKNKKKKPKSNSNVKKLNFIDGSLNWKRSLPYHVKNAVVSHRWSVIGNYFPALIHMADFAPHYIWKVGFPALCSSDEASDQDKLKFISTTLQVTRTISLVPILDSAVYLMYNGDFETAYKQITMHFDIKQTRKTTPRYVYYLRGLQGFAAAFQCFKKLNECDATKEATDHTDEMKLLSADASNFAKSAIKHFADAFNAGYAWDNMVEIYCELLLQQDESVDEITRILQDYIIKKPNHPTSYVLLITFLKNCCPEETADLIQTLKDLASKCPSDPRILELCKLLGDSELKLQFTMLANMVDFYQWKENTDVWKLLSRAIRRFLCNSDEDDRAFLKVFWHSRVTWWPIYHFNNLATEENAKRVKIKLIQYKKEVRDCLQEFDKKSKRICDESGDKSMESDNKAKRHKTK